VQKIRAQIIANAHFDAADVNLLTPDTTIEKNDQDSERDPPVHAVEELRWFGMPSALTKPRMCNMSTIQSEQQRFSANRFHACGSSLGISAAVKLIELGIALDEASDSIPGFCFYCLAPRNTHSSTAQFPNVFCSEQCEQTFVCGPLASLTTEDCIRRHNRLKNLLM
jgi:hypothetical protein